MPLNLERETHVKLNKSYEEDSEQHRLLCFCSIHNGSIIHGITSHHSITGMKDYEFVIEVLKDDGICIGGEFRSEQRLFNEKDLNILTRDFDKKRVMIRLKYDTNNVYYYSVSGEGWSYGLIENAINTIKRQI